MNSRPDRPACTYCVVGSTIWRKYSSTAVQQSSCHFVSGLNQQTYLPCGRADKSINRLSLPGLYIDAYTQPQLDLFAAVISSRKKKEFALFLSLFAVHSVRWRLSGGCIPLAAYRQPRRLPLSHYMTRERRSLSHVHAQSQSLYGSQLWLRRDLSLFAFMQRLIR